MIRIELPLPPSLNNAYVNVPRRGRVPSKDHKAWVKDAEAHLMWKRVGRMEGPYIFQMFVNSKMLGDVSNRIKLAEDLLVHNGITSNDRLAQGASCYRSKDVTKGMCVIIISPSELL